MLEAAAPEEEEDPPDPPKQAAGEEGRVSKANSARGEGICPPDGPIRLGERVYAHRTDQSDEGRGHMPTGRTNQMRGEGICPPDGPIR
eukprot:1196226-Prorocentrum_minimum.AAC.5